MLENDRWLIDEFDDPADDMSNPRVRFCIPSNHLEHVESATVAHEIDRMHAYHPDEAPDYTAEGYGDGTYGSDLLDWLRDNNAVYALDVDFDVQVIFGRPHVIVAVACVQPNQDASYGRDTGEQLDERRYQVEDGTGSVKECHFVPSDDGTFVVNSVGHPAAADYDVVHICGHPDNYPYNVSFSHED